MSKKQKKPSIFDSPDLSDSREAPVEPEPTPPQQAPKEEASGGPDLISLLSSGQVPTVEHFVGLGFRPQQSITIVEGLKALAQGPEQKLVKKPFRGYRVKNMLPHPFWAAKQCFEARKSRDVPIEDLDEAGCRELEAANPAHLVVEKFGLD